MRHLVDALYVAAILVPFAVLARRLDTAWRWSKHVAKAPKPAQPLPTYALDARDLCWHRVTSSDWIGVVTDCGRSVFDFDVKALRSTRLGWTDLRYIQDGRVSFPCHSCRRLEAKCNAPS